MILIQAHGSTCRLVFSTYAAGGATAMTLQDDETGEPVATVTVNLPGQLEPGEVAIKDYSEGAGMLAVMQKAGVVSEPHRYIDSGYVQIPVCTLLVDPE